MTAHTGDQGATAKTNKRPAGRTVGRRPSDTFAVRLLLVRHLQGLSIKQAAEETGLNDATWATWEGGRKPRDVLDICRRIAEQWDIDLDWLVFGGPLAGSRGMPTKRSDTDTGRYGDRPVRPTDNRPSGRPKTDRPASPNETPSERRAVRINYPIAA